MEQEKSKNLISKNTWGTVLIFCATLGLAPWVPEPHVWGKLRWVLGGANGMSWMDWGDFLMHGLPWILLMGLLIRAGFERYRKSKSLKIK